MEAWIDLLERKNNLGATFAKQLHLKAKVIECH
jgi:hypothetical protein